MARAAAKGGRRTQANARRDQRRSSGRRRNLSAHEQSLFFSRIRRSAKWAYVLLAVAFALTFAFVGVGSGDNGALSQLFNNVFGTGSSTTSVSKAQSEIKKNPRDAKGYNDLATAYEAKNDTTDAITALQEYTALKPKDTDALARLASLQVQQAQSLSQQSQTVSQQQQDANVAQQFGPSSTSTLGKALGTDPVQSAVSSAIGTQSSTVYSQLQAAYSSAVSTYQTLEKLQPGDANVAFQLAQTAQSAQNISVAVAAYKRYLKLDPSSQYAAQIKTLIKQLQPAPAKKPVAKKHK